MSADTLKLIRCCVVLAVAGAAQPALAADAYNGERLARRWCESCHVVATDQRQANAEAPPFATIATARF